MEVEKEIESVKKEESTPGALEEDEVDEMKQYVL